MRLGPLLAGVTALAISCAATPAAWACSCFAIGPSCQNAFQVEAVFVGRVVAITDLPADGPPLREGEIRQPRAVRVDFAEVDAYRGPRSPLLSIVTGSASATCGYRFTRGERYVVYARKSEDAAASLETSICSRTRPLAEAAEDLTFLRRLETRAPARARVSGTITHWERDLATGQPLEIGPVPDVLVTVRGSSTSFQGTTDEQGRYEVLVPPGQYEVNASLPPPFAALRQPQSLTLPDPRACFVADFGVNFAGRISGLARLASGEPAAGVAVHVMAASDVGKTGNLQTLRATSDAGGRFEFTDVSPGRYVVGIDLTRAMNADLVFPPTYHPGTGDAASATVVQLEGGEQRELEPLVLPPARRPHQLTGTVLFPDGIAVSGAVVSLWDGREQWRQVAVGIKTESDGAFSIRVHEGLSYLARVSYWDETQRRQLETTVGPFVAGPDTPPLRVVLSAAAR